MISSAVTAKMLEREISFSDLWGRIWSQPYKTIRDLSCRRVRATSVAESAGPEEQICFGLGKRGEEGVEQ